MENVHGLLRRGVFVGLGHDGARCVRVGCKREIKVTLGWLGKWRWGWRRVVVGETRLVDALIKGATARNMILAFTLNIHQVNECGILY